MGFFVNNFFVLYDRQKISAKWKCFRLARLEPPGGLFFSEQEPQEVQQAQTLKF
jgi:hypothetical protein